MKDESERSIEQQYARGNIREAIFDALRRQGKRLDQLTPADLAPLDQFHVRGREATVELATRAAVQPGQTVLDVGCGLGGSARYLATEHRCKVTGIDVTREYVEVARALAEAVGLNRDVSFQQASALDLPFDDESFDLVWTEHAQMNVADKQAFYAELARVLKPGGRLAFHDLFQGNGGDVRYPTPWANSKKVSSLVAPADVCGMIECLGFNIVDWEDRTQHTVDWFERAMAKVRAGSSPLGLHILMGESTLPKFENLVRNLREERVIAIQAVLEKE